MADDVMLNQAIEAIQKGQRARARDLLTRLLRADQSNPLYWLWMSSVVETTKEQIYCLQTVLRLDPGNQAARRGLVLIGAMPAGEEVTPVPPIRRQWQAKEIAEPPTGIRALWANPLLRTIAIGAAALLILGMVIAGIFGFRQRTAQLASRPTQRSGPPPTFTLTPTPLGGKPTAKVTPSPTYSGPKPLWMYLEATYTPTPLYVNTPHPISEAFRAGQRAFLRGDMNTALSFLRQASQVDPTAADILYYIGEVQRYQGDYKAALEAYNQAIALNAGFAPAYLGRARTRLTLEPGAEVSQDLDLAIQYDPNLAEAYLERAAYRLRKGEIEAAMPDLQAAESLLPDSPLVFLYRSQAALARGDAQQALSLAQEANRRDITLLPTYLWLGKAHLANQDTQEAINALQTFVTYAPDDPQGWLTLAQAYAEIDHPDLAYADLQTTQGGQDLQAALEACNRAIALNQENAELYLYRGLIYLAEGKGQLAVNDLVAARRLEAKSFPINLALGRALLVAGRAREAFAQIDGSQALAQSDKELAAVHYWRAQAAEALNLKPAAITDWRGLLELPAEDVPQAWMMAANEHLATLIPPSVTPTATNTVTPTKAATLTPSRTPTKTPSPSNIPSATKTSTP